MSGLFGGKANNAQQAQQAQGIRVQSSVYGKPLSIVYGTNRISGNLLWYGDFVATSHSQSAGGKGGGGGGNQSYTYSAAVAIALCEGPISGIGYVWEGQNVHPSPGALASLGFTLFQGTYPQSPWSYLTTNHPGQDLPYGGIAYIANPSLALGSSPNLPNYSFEVFGLIGGGVNVNAGVIVNDFLTNANYGCGWHTGWINATLLAQYELYCNAMGFLFSPVYDSQTQAQQAVQDLVDSSNSTCWWSEGTLKIYPYADQSVTGNGYTFNPNVTPVYALTDDHFIFKQGQDPIQITRTSPADSYNIVDLEFVNQANYYATEIAEAKDLYAISQYGPRYDTVKTYHHITNAPTAQVVAQLALQRDLYIRNTYQFTLGWAFCALEPMDLVTLTDTRMGLNGVAVRITGVEENANGELTFTAEDFPAGFATAPLYTTQSPAGAQPNWNVAAPNVDEVVFYEPPGELTNNQLEIWIGASGVALGSWGGCDIWTSVDGSTYVKQGTINGGSRVGVLTAPLPSGSDPDTVNTLSLDMSPSNGVLNSGTQNDADTYNTLCVVGQELISYETATLTGTSKYNLTYLRRGAYGSNITSHLTGEKFMRFDQGVFQYNFAANRIGTPVYFKFVSFNQYGAGYQSLAAVPTYTYTIAGTALNAPLPNVVGLYTNFVAGITQLFWAPVVDYRSFDYEVRLGQSWSSGQVLGRTSKPSFGTQGDGTYWVAAHYRAPSGNDVYSAAPAEVVIAGSILVQNVVQAYDEAATFWPGVCTPGAAINTSLNALLLDGNNNFLMNADVLHTPDVLWAGGVQLSGSYALPAAQAVNAGRVATCSVRMSFNGYGQSIFDNFLHLPNVLAVTDMFSAALGPVVSIIPQIAVAPASGVYGPWQNYQPGTYTGQYFKAQVLLATTNSQVTALVTDVTFAVDVPDRLDRYTNQAIATGGTTLTYQVGGVNTPFNGGPNGASVPNVQVTILNGSQGDDVLITSKTLTSVTIQVVNGGVGVARTVDVFVQGY